MSGVAVQVTDWIPREAMPVREGEYEVRNSRQVHWKHALVGSRRRYWDGARWLTEKGGSPSVFGSHDSHEWRGVRRWVLTVPGDFDGEVDYVVSISKRKVLCLIDQLHNQNFPDVQPMTFDSEADAKAWGARYSSVLGDGWKAVLP